MGRFGVLGEDVAANIAEEEKTWLYLLRLAAFLVIAVAVAVKNRR